jgi:hypothetical protein
MLHHPHHINMYHHPRHIIMYHHPHRVITMFHPQQQLQLHIQQTPVIHCAVKDSTVKVWAALRIFHLLHLRLRLRLCPDCDH